MRETSAVMTHFPPERVAVAVERACVEYQLDAQFIPSVYAYLAEDEDAWPGCCGSDCAPCVQTLAHAARRALALLESPPAGA